MSTPIITVSESMMSHVRSLSLTYPQLRDVCAKALICKSIFIEGRLSAIFGIEGAAFGEKGIPWIFQAPEVRFSQVVFLYEKELRKLQKMFSVLENYIRVDNRELIKRAKILGFTVNQGRIPFEGELYRRAERRA